MNKNIEQGTIILINGSPTMGREQSGKRPFIIISATQYNSRGLIIFAAPITTNRKSYYEEVELFETKTVGVVLANQVRTFDLEARPYTILEKAPIEIVKNVLEIVNALCEIPN